MPLRQIGIGLLVVVFAVRVAGFDVLCDPVGWLLVIGATQRIGGDDRTRSRVTTAAVTAFVIAVPLAVPSLAARVRDADPSVAWALSLPQIAVVLLLALHLGASAQAAGDVDAAAWWRWARTGAIVVALAPVIVYPTGSEELIGLTLLLSLLTMLFTVGLLLRHAPRGWAGSTGPVISAPEPPSAS